MEHQHAVRATVGLNNEGLKSWKKRNWMWRIYEFICKYNCNFITGLVNEQWFRMNVYDFLLFTALQVEID